MKRLPGIFARGMAMGAADVVPGVSGGTLALITGIYEELVNSLGNLHPRLLRVWQQQGFMAFWRAANLGFLVTLFAGIITSIALLARAITWTMQHYPVPLWAFFCGLIIASVWVVLRPVTRYTATLWLCFLIAAAVAWWIGTLPGLRHAAGDGVLVYFLAGAVAICAMILPGISGSFILVLLGMYAPVLAAVKQFELPLLLAFVGGCAVGLLSFVHLLRWLLHRFHDPVMGLLAGFMVGSVNKLWPWRVELSDSLVQQNVLPGAYEQATGLPAMMPAALAAVLVGVALVAWLALVDRRQRG